MSEQNYPWLKSYDPDIQWDMPLETESLYSLLAKTVQEHGNKPALNFLGKRYTWKDIGEQVDKFAHGLAEKGIGKGDHVGLFLPNCPYYLIAYFAILKRGATVVNFNPLYAERELTHQIKDSQIKTMITVDLKLTTDKMYKMMDDGVLENLILCKFTDVLPFPKNFLFRLFKAWDLATKRNSDKISWFHNLMKNDGSGAEAMIDPQNDVAVLQYTGGTTGVPKGAMLTHSNLYANALQSYANFPAAQSQQKILAVLPFFHVFAMTVTLNLAVKGGMEIITIPRFDLNETLDIIHKLKPDYMPAVPAIFSAMNNHPKISSYDLSSLKFCISGGAPLPVSVKKAFEEKTGAVVVEGYGLTESSPVTNVNPPLGKNIAGSIGLPIPGTIVEIIDPEDKTTPMKPGERGEVCIRGPQVMKGYWNKPKETADVLTTLPDGSHRLHTGDIGIMDENGYFYIVDRIKDMIITNGYNVYPRNVEEAIYLHPSVEECIVAGRPDEQRGEIIKAWIKCKDGQQITEAELRSFLTDKLSKMEMPKLIEFRSTPLPKTMIGKLSRKDIIAMELGNG
ncbi:MAG: long-chain fatty acid--CoA ligase [Alphaproteobacteria bacterium]|nr:long-chain fatty acid--CoA ligase [Alphaproteobacteria bacterium]